MSKVDLISREWCELVFEGRNKAYGAYDLRSKAGKRHLLAIIDIILGIVAIGAIVAASIAAKEYIAANMNENDVATELSELQKEEVKKEEPKVEVKQEEQPKQEMVKVAQTIQFTVPEIVDHVEAKNEMKTQDEAQNLKGKFGGFDQEGSLDEDAVKRDEIGDRLMGDRNIKVEEQSSAKEEEEAKVYNVVEQPPTFPGGEAALLKYIATHVKYPESAMNDDVQGVVNLRFVVMEDGSVGDVQVARSLQKDCDKEAQRVVKSLPRFIPGKQQGKAVRVWFSLPVRFQLQ